MSKKYYSKKHRSYNKKSKNTGSSFMLRLNISLGIAIIVIGIYKLNNDLSQSLTDKFKSLASDSISFSQIDSLLSSVSDLGRNVSTFAYSDDNSITLDESVIEYINNTEDTYAQNNAAAISP